MDVWGGTERKLPDQGMGLNAPATTPQARLKALRGAFGNNSATFKTTVRGRRPFPSVVSASEGIANNSGKLDDCSPITRLRISG